MRETINEKQAILWKQFSSLELVQPADDFISKRKKRSPTRLQGAVSRVTTLEENSHYNNVVGHVSRLVTLPVITIIK